MYVIRLALALALVAASSAVQLHVVCSPSGNDVYAILSAASYPNMTRHDTLAQALAAAQPADGLMLFADALKDATKTPQCNATVQISASQWASIAQLGLRVYAEFPSTLPGATAALTCAQTMYERAVVTGNSTGLPLMALLNPHKHVDYVQLPQAWVAHSELVLAKVAGYDSATLGLPALALTFPLLVPASDSILIGAAQLSHMRTRRFAPSASWMSVVRHILTFVLGDSPGLPTQPLWQPTVRASFGPSDPLPKDAQLKALHRGVQFYRNAKLMPTAQRVTQLAALQCDQGADTSDACGAFARLSPPFGQAESSEGQLGMLEGFTSDISLQHGTCLLYTSPSPRDRTRSRMPSSA
eukprot:TRINITY_DN2360_c0_g1_i1.p1 TRINITY_DN2360_c0_g1~~TRINITY_DN2360_c0_g1_i1.p1  ORF type:complete len:356 (+),score=78.93 TRINITY_DN2360_c0_g1_i1:181-1248(+)